MKQKNHSGQKDIAKAYRQAGPYLGLGFQLAASIVLMLYIGLRLDEKFDLYPVLTIVFSFFGGFAGIYNMIKTTLKLNKKSE